VTAIYSAAMPAWVRRHRLFFIALAVLALARAWWAWRIVSIDAWLVIFADSPGYLDPARALLEDGRFLRAPGEEPMFARTPGYPLLIAALLAVWDDLRWLSSAQALLSVIPVGIVYAIGHRLFGDGRWAWLAAGIVAVDPLQNVLATNVLSESWSTVSMALVALAGWRVFTRPPSAVGWLDAGLLGLATAWATMVRPTTYYLPILLAALVVWHVRPVPWRRAGALVLGLALPFLLVVGGWSARNHEAFGSWRLTSVDAINLYCYRGVEVEARASGRTVEEVRADFGCTGEVGGFDPDANCAPWGACSPTDGQREGEYYDAMASEGMRVLLRHPVETTVLLGWSAAAMVLGPGTMTVQEHLSISPWGLFPALPLALWTFALTGLAVVGAAAGLRGRASLRTWWLFCVVVIGYWVLVSSMGPDSYSRFRAPLIPFVALLAVAGVRALLGYVRSRDGDGPPPAAADRMADDLAC
jgi:4-amino-4-deoxy-L-arabinose transferase-like glycosyltransferase